MTTELVTYSLEDRVALVRMDDGKANALSHAMIDALLGAVERAEQEAAAMVLMGRSERFCAGFDLRVMMSSPEAAKALLRRGASLFMRLYGLALPLVIGCTGHALAGGALTLLTGDLRIGAEGHYRIGLNEVSIGLPVPVLAAELARDRLAPSELTRATLMARLYAPDEAVTAGYLDEVVPPSDVLARSRELAASLTSLARPAFKASKERLRGRTIDYIEASLEDDMSSLLTGQ